MRQENPQFESGTLEPKDQILKTLESESYPEKKLYKYILRYGRKELLLTVRYQEARQTLICDTFFKNIHPESERKENETTQLMKYTQQLIQNLSDTIGEPILLLFHTNHKGFNDWAKSTGNNLFHWQESYRTGFRVSHKYEAVLSPNEKNEV